MTHIRIKNCGFRFYKEVMNRDIVIDGTVTPSSSGGATATVKLRANTYYLFSIPLTWSVENFDGTSYVLAVGDSQGNQFGLTKSKMDTNPQNFIILGRGEDCNIFVRADQGSQVTVHIEEVELTLLQSEEQELNVTAGTGVYNRPLPTVENNTFLTCEYDTTYISRIGATYKSRTANLPIYITDKTLLTAWQVGAGDAVGTGQTTVTFNIYNVLSKSANNNN